MLQREPLLVTLVKMVDRIPMPNQPQTRKRGRPYVYQDRPIAKALIIMIAKRLYLAYSLLTFLQQETTVAHHWGKSDYHSWYYDWKLHLAVTVAALWIPLATRLTPVNLYDGYEAIPLLEEVPLEAQFVLGDNHYKTPEFRAYCQANNRLLVASGRGPYPHDDSGIKVLQVFHLLCSKSIESFNQLFKCVFDWHDHVPVKGLQRTSLVVLATVLLYQLIMRHKPNKKPRNSASPQQITCFLSQYVYWFLNDFFLS